MQIPRYVGDTRRRPEGLLRRVPRPEPMPHEVRVSTEQELYRAVQEKAAEERAAAEKTAKDSNASLFERVTAAEFLGWAIARRKRRIVLLSRETWERFLIVFPKGKRKRKSFECIQGLSR